MTTTPTKFRNRGGVRPPPNEQQRRPDPRFTTG